MMKLLCKARVFDYSKDINAYSKRLLGIYFNLIFINERIYQAIKRCNKMI